MEYPSRETLRQETIEWAKTRNGEYHTDELVKHLANRFDIDLENDPLNENGVGKFVNLVAWATASMTRMGLHEKIKPKMYVLTDKGQVKDAQPTNEVYEQIRGINASIHQLAMQVKKLEKSITV